jgi:hypothetical protein
MKNDLLNRVRIASPCNVNWESMTGNERVRHCSQCDLQVYDISELTPDQAIALIISSEGRFCARLHRRADGSVITRDCPVGLRALRQRIARRAGAVFATVLGLSATLFAQIGSRSLSPVSAEPTVQKSQANEERAVIAGTVTDTIGGVIEEAKVELVDEITHTRLMTVTDHFGEFRFGNLRPGKYSLQIERPFFMKLVITEIVLRADQTVRLASVLQVRTESITVGGVMVNPEPLSTDANQLSDHLILKKPQ